MRTFLLTAAAVGIAVVSFGTAAEATPITFASSVSFTHNSSSNLTFHSSGLNTSLTVGAPATVITDFITVMVASGAATDSGTVAANFTFTTPSGMQTDSGSITGEQVNGSSSNSTLSITWPNQPVEFDFTDGIKLDVTLGNLSENCSGNNCLNAGGSYDISGTFFLLSGPTTAVPEPLTLSLFGAGLAGAAALRRRSKKAQKA
jgi:hypothetical protein